MFKLKQTIKVALCFSALLCAALTAQDKRPVAVLEPFTAGPVTSLNKNIVMSNMNTSLVNTGIYRVVDRVRSEQILKQQGIKRNHLSNPGWAKRLGKLLGAELICFADITKEAGYLNTKLSIIDVESGEITNAAQKLITRDDPDLIDKAIKEAMLELLGIKPSPPRQIEAGRRQRPSDDGVRVDSAPTVKIKVMVQAVPSYYVVEGVEKGIRGIKGVENVSAADYQGTLATFEVATNLSAQQLAAGIGDIHVAPGPNYSPQRRLRVYEASNNIVKIQYQ